MAVQGSDWLLASGEGFQYELLLTAKQWHRKTSSLLNQKPIIYYLIQNRSDCFIYPKFVDKHWLALINYKTKN